MFVFPTLNLGVVGTGHGSNLIAGEQDVIDLAPTFWMDASSADAVKSVDSGAEANATNGQDVSKWVSRVGSGVELAQSTASKRPIFNATNADFNDYSTITFDHTADTALFANASYTGTSGTGATVFYVGKELGGDANARIINWGTEKKASLGHNYSSVPFFFFAPLATYPGTNDTIELQPYMAAFVIDSSSSFFSINEGTDAAITFSATNHFDSGGITSVGGYNKTGENSSTVAAEYIIFDSALSAANVAKVETYLKNKYTDGSGF